MAQLTGKQALEEVLHQEGSVQALFFSGKLHKESQASNCGRFGLNAHTSSTSGSPPKV